MLSDDEIGSAGDSKGLVDIYVSEGRNILCGGIVGKAQSDPSRFLTLDIS